MKKAAGRFFGGVKNGNADLKNIDIAFVCMSPPYEMSLGEAAECVKAFKPKIVYAYHYFGNTKGVQEFSGALRDTKGLEIRIRQWY